MTRLEANRQILSELSNLIETHPDLRFIQALSGLDIIEPLYDTDWRCIGYKDTFHEESEKTLKRILEE